MSGRGLEAAPAEGPRCAAGRAGNGGKGRGWRRHDLGRLNGTPAGVRTFTSYCSVSDAVSLVLPVSTGHNNPGAGSLPPVLAGKKLFKVIA